VISYTEQGLMNTAGIFGHSRQLKSLNSLIEKKMIPSSLLFTGASGIGKKTIAKRVIASLFCAESNSPCLDCSNCSRVYSGTFPDLIELEKDDKGKIPVGDRNKPEYGSVRWLIEKLNNSSVSGRYGVIIDGVDTISESGQNALLKTIEEPPMGTCIILIGESKSRVLHTILSRSLHLNFNPLSNDDVKEILKEQDKDGQYKELVMLISGGSVETAMKLMDETVLNSVIEYASWISAAVQSGGELSGDLPDLPKSLSNDFLLAVLMEFYLIMLSGKILSGNEIPKSLLIKDKTAVKKIIKILLAMRSGLDNNMNFKSMIKGLLYSCDQFDLSGFSKPDFTWIK